MWLHYLALAVAIIVVSYGISVWSFSAFLDDQGIYQGEDGRFYSRLIDDAEDAPPTFTYTLQESVVEAFRVGDTMLPAWVQEDGIDVIISKPQRVVLHRADGETVTVPQGDYVVRCHDGTYYWLTAKEAKDVLVKIEVGEGASQT